MLLYKKINKYQTGGTLAELKYKLLNTEPQKEVKANLINPMATKMYPSKYNWNPNYYGWQSEERLENPSEYMKMGGAGLELDRGLNLEGFTQAMQFQEKDEYGRPLPVNINQVEGKILKNLPKGLGSLGVKTGIENLQVDGFYNEIKPRLGVSYSVNKGFPIKNGYVNFSGSVDKEKDFSRIGGGFDAEKYFSPKLSANVGARFDKDNYNKNWNINAGLKYRF